MLQQTTVATVIPYYQRFLQRFPKVKDLAQAPTEEVLEAWAGLGYYSRARNLHAAAQRLAATGFPRHFEELLELPGFGPYTSRAVASLAFGQAVGVLDGNVIRVLSRRYGWPVEHWKQPGRKQLQDQADLLASRGDSSQINQALMELGATVCTPAKPACLLCPWKSSCVARATETIDRLPLKKPRRSLEKWLWRPYLWVKDGKVALSINKSSPFLKGQWLLPNQAKRLKTSPKDYDFKHGITHHEIFVKITKGPPPESLQSEELQWVARENLKKVCPVSLVRKVCEFHRES